MTDRINLHLDASGLASGLSAAGAEMNRLAREEIAPAATEPPGCWPPGGRRGGCPRGGGR